MGSLRFGRNLPPTLYGVIWQRTMKLQLAVVGLGLALPPLAVVPLEIQRRIVDDAIPATDLDLLFYLGVAYLAAVAVASLAKFVIYYLRGLIEAKVTRYLRLIVLDRHRHRPASTAQGAVGPVSSILVEEAFPLGGFASEAINTPLIEGGALIGVAGFMLYAEPWLAAIGLGSMLLQALVVPLVQIRINRLARRRVNAIRRANADMIGATARAGGLHFHDSLREVRLAFRLRLQMNVYKAALKAFLKLSDNTAIILVLAVGGFMVMQGTTTLGVIVAFLAGLKRLQEPWDALMTFYRTVADAHIKYRLILGAMTDSVDLERDTAPGPAVALQLP